MSIRRMGGAALIAGAVVILAYTILGAVNIVWGVSQIDEMPVTVKLFLPVIFGTLFGTLSAMMIQRLRRRRQPRGTNHPAQG